jgi:hypothetical protein
MNIVLVAFLLILSGMPAFSASLYNPSTSTGGVGGGLTPEQEAVLNAALTNVPTLQAVVTAGNTATNIGDLTITGRVVHGYGMNVTNIAADALGAQQAGRNFGPMTMTIAGGADGAQQAGQNNGGTMLIDAFSDGAQQAGQNNGTMTIGISSYGAQQVGHNMGTMTIGEAASGAQQRGYVAYTAYATNNAIGAWQLLNLTNGQSATVTSNGSASIGLGACVVSNKQSIVAGDGQVSHGNGSMTAGGGFHWGDNPVLTNISVNGNPGSVAGAIAYANIDIPNYDPVTSQIFVDSVSGQELIREYATASLASSVTDTWHAISISTNGLVVAAWTRDVASGKGYVYTGTNGPNSLIKSTALGLQTSADVKVLPDGSKIFVTHLDDPWYNGSYLKTTTNNGSSWTTLLPPGSASATIESSDDGQVLVIGMYMSTNSGVSWFSTPGNAHAASSAHAVSGDGNVVMVVDWGPPAGENIYHISTNRGASFTNAVSGSTYAPYLGWGLGYSCATRTGDRIYIATSGNPSGPQGEGNVAYLEAPNYDTLHRITPGPGNTNRIAYQSVSCSPDGRGIIAVAERIGGTGRSGSAYVSTNFGVTWSDATNLIDVGAGTTQPHWLGICEWGYTFDGGYAVKGGSGEGKIYKVEVGSVTTNAVNILGDMTVYGSVTAEGGFSGDGSGLTGITAAQVGAVATNDARYLSAWQNPADATNWTWTKTATEVTLTGYTGPNAVVIPDMLDGLPVTGFGAIFRNSLVITNVSGGANIKTLPASAFSSCTALTSVILPNAATISNSVFGSCTALTYVSLPNAATISNSAFSSCTALTYVNLPNVTTIGSTVFNSCTALTSVSLPNVTTIGSTVFNSCTALASVSMPNATTIGNTVFNSCTNLTSVSLPKVVTIGNSAFAECYALTSVSLPSATTVGNYAFDGCSSLTSVYFSQNAPAQATDVYNLSPNVTNYVTSPTATGWDTTWNGRPVVRMTVYSDSFVGNGAGLTNITAAQVGAATTSAVSFAAAPACYQITLVNTSALSWTNTWLPTNKVSRVTLTSTGTVTFVWNWPTQQDAGMRFALDMTGMPSVVFPVGAIYLTNGIYGSSAPVLGQSNYVSVTHDCNTYQITVITNTLGTWGTP